MALNPFAWDGCHQGMLAHLNQFALHTPIEAEAIYMTF